MRVLLRNKAMELRPALLALFCLWLGALLSACSEKPYVMDFAGETMGTSYHITVVDTEAKLDRQQLKRAIERSLFKTNQQMSHYLPDSELSQLSRLGGGTSSQELSPEMLEVLTVSQDIARLSAGAFDITISPLVDLWGFGPGSTEKDRVPAAEDIATALAASGYQGIRIEQGKLIKDKALVLNLSAVAKGFGADQVAKVLDKFGADNYLVEIGGEMLLKGNSPRGGPWRIAIEKPSVDGRQIQRAISVTGKGVATSGDYRNYFEKEGKRYSHTIDPRTGKPITHNLASVTVIADTAAEADAWATAIMVLGEKQGLVLAEQQKLAAYMLVKQEAGFSVEYSKAFATYVQ